MDRKDLYSNFTSLLLLCITGGLLYCFSATAVFTVLTAVSRFMPVFKDIADITFALLMILGTAFALIMSISFILRKEIVPFIPTRKIWMKYLVKLSQSVAKRIKLDPDKAVRSFITVSNAFVLNELASRKKEVSKVLILLPHCIQLNSCAFKITSDVHNCRKCGKCVISGFIDISEKFGIDVYVSTGGTMARMVVKERRPHLILAVACERDLLSGIKDTLKMPVVGILNERPNGPCINTTVSTEAVENMIKKVYNPKKVA